jgi:glycosyltransferase involved in cell wall biosynthesis
MVISESSSGLISVIIPCYNHGNYLHDAIDSVQRSSYSPIEIIVIDDGSTYNTREVALKLQKRHLNIHYYYQENLGTAAARNLGIKISNGEFILPLDADDRISEQYIEKAANVLKKNDQVKVVYCDAEFFGLKSGHWKLKEFSLKKLALRNMIFSCAMYRKCDYEIAGGYFNGLIHGHEDWDFWISMLKDGGMVHKLNLTGFFYRIHENSRRRTTARKSKKESIEIINQRHYPFLVKYLKGPIRSQKKLTIPINASIRAINLFFSFLKIS